MFSIMPSTVILFLQIKYLSDFLYIKKRKCGGLVQSKTGELEYNLGHTNLKKYSNLKNNVFPEQNDWIGCDLAIPISACLSN